MNICMLSELFYPFMLGGAERRYYEIAVRLAKKHNVTVSSLRFRGHEDREYHRGVEIIRTGIKHPLDTRRLPPLATYAPALFQSIRGNFDVIDANQGIASFVGVFKPFVSEPIIATFHDIYWNQWNEYFPFPFSSFGKTMEFAWSKLGYSKIIAVSEFTMKKLKYLGFRSPVEVIPSGIDNKVINRITASKKDLSIVFVGRLVKYKNVDMLLKACAMLQEQYPELILKIVGSGPEEANLKKSARSLGVNARFYGFVSEEEKFKLIKSSTVLVNPSSVEGLGLILIESMACGTPIIAQDIDTYYFCNRKNSILYANESEMRKKLSVVLGDQKMRKRLGKEGTKTSKEFSWDSVAQKIEDVYESVVK